MELQYFLTLRGSKFALRLMPIDELQNEILFPIRSKRIEKDQNETSTTSFGHLTNFNRILINYSGQAFLLNKF